MTGLKRYELNFDLALAHLHYSLSAANKLSSKLMELLDFNSGVFFTMLPDSADLKKINEFRHGGFSSGVRDLVRLMLLNRLRLDNKLSYVFDNVAEVFVPEYNDLLFQSCGLTYENEIYYLVTKENASPELVNQCFCASDAIWHSLCVLFSANFAKTLQRDFSLKQIEDVCLNAQLIIVGAYDAEGFVFWEKG